MLRKYASLQVLEAWRVPAQAGPATLRKSAHRVAFDYEPRAGYLYVRSRMISSRTNDNHDTFPAREIEKGYQSFLGKPVFVNHHNANHRRARGVIVAVALHRDKNRDGTPDVWVEGLMEVDAVRFPKLAKAILAGKVNRTSMGVDVEWSRCSACGNKATSPAEYCRHLPAMKGRKIRKTNPRTGKVEERLIHEICAGLSFFENSLLVEEPADPTAYFLGQPDARGLGKAAAKEPPQFSENFTHCMNCGVHLEEPPRIGQYPRDMDRGSNTPGDWRHHGYPGLCMNCAIGPLDESGNLTGTPGKPHPIFPHDRGGYQGSPADAGYAEDAGMPGELRRWDRSDPVRQSMSSKTAALDQPHQGRMQGGDCRRNCTYGGTHCLVCGEPVRINLHKTDTNSGGWHHHDGMKRDHLALPADPDGVIASIPGQLAQYDQARQQMADHLHSQFEQLSGRSLPRRPRGDEDQMPPDPFLASRKTADNWYPRSTHCIGCGRGFGGPDSGNWPSARSPHLCNDCATGHTGEPSEHGKPPAIEHEWPDMGGRPSSRALVDKMSPDVRGVRPWTPDDALRSSYSAKKREGGDHPFFHQHPVSSANIVAAYHDTTPDEKSLGDRWYADAHHVAKAIAGGDAAVGAGLLSAYSPQTAWPVNMFNASRAAQGDPPGPGTGAMGSQQRPAMRILAGEHHSQVLKASKTAAFAHLIEHGGDTPEDEASGNHKVVVDRHALSVAVGHRLTKEEGAKAPLDQPQHYHHVAQAYREAAHILSSATGRKISPHQVQAATWLRQIRKNQDEDRSGAKGGGGKGRVQMHDNSRTRWQNHHKEHHPGAIPEDNMHHHGALQAIAYGETRVPPKVDTLRMEECPVCGEHDVWSGDRCPVCGFVVPPSLFRDPDTSKAQEVRDQLDQAGEVTTGPDGMAQTAPGTGPDGQIGSGEDADDQLMHPDQLTPNGTPTVQGGGELQPGEDTDGAPGDEEAEEGEEQEPGEEMPPDDSANPEDQGQQEMAEGQQLQEQGEEEQQQGQEDEAEGEQLEQQGEEDELEPQEPEDELECPACGAQFAIDGAAQPGVPCPACKMAALVPLEDPGNPGVPPEGAEDPSDPEEEDEGEEEMPPTSKTGATLAQVQASRIAGLTAENEVLRAQLSFLANAAGVDRELAQIRARVMQRHADVLNPASPVPDPPQAPPTQTTEQALQSGSARPAGQNGAPPRGTGHSQDDPSRPGSAPGSLENVPAEATTTSMTPGVEIQTPPATNLTDVTAPVQGTNPSQDGGVPLEQRRIETDVRVDPDPLKAHGPGIGGQGDNGAAFPWMLDARQPGQQKAASLQPNEGDSAQRTFASIRLAKLRVTAGIAQGDELTVAERIEKDASLPTAMIEHEISVLSSMPVVDQRQAARPVQRTAARQVPSLASVGAMQQYASAANYGAIDDLDGSDLFF